MNLIKEGDFTIAEMKHIGRSYRLLRKQYGNGDLIQFLYDQGRRLTSKETRNKNSDLINHYKYGYNKVHMKTYEQRLHDSGKGNVMDYDAFYRLKKMKFNVPVPTSENPTEFDREKTIKFDQLDNILSMVENFNDQIKTITTDIPENSDYSKLNQYTSFDKWGLAYDKNGNTTQRGNQQLSYDFRNQIVTALDTPSNTQVEMKYDVLGRRIQKSVTIGSQTKIENYYHSGHQVIEVRDDNDQLLRQYIYGNGIDEIIRMDKFENGTITSYYFHTDANGSVTAITDADGNLVERVTYDIYGMPTFWDAAGNKIPKSSIGNNILFHGREYDYELNLYYFRARYYCPIMGRFLQTDPMGYTDSMNLYQGFAMNPVNFADPMGTVLNLKLKDIYGSVESAENVVKSVYSQFILSGDTHSVAYKKLLDYKFVIDHGSIEDQNYEMGLAQLPYLNVFDVTPAQFAKDVLGGLVNALTSMASMAAKGLPGGYNPYALTQIDKAMNWAQGKVNNAIGANEGSLGYWMGETYGTAIAFGWLSAELQCATATVRIEKTLPFKTIPKLRQQYVGEVSALKDKIQTLEKAGMTKEEIAKILYSERNALKIKYRKLTPANRLKEIENRCLSKYGNKLGPTIEQLRAKGKTWEQIIESSTRPGGQDLGF